MPSLTVERVSVNLVPESGPASASPPEIKTVRGQAIDAKQRVPYIVGVSAALTGAHGLSMRLVTLPPGGSCRPHVHVGSESALFIVSGNVETRFGENLRESVRSTSGDFLFIPTGVPHQGCNLSDTEPVIAVVARNDADEQERVIPYYPVSCAGMSDC